MLPCQKDQFRLDPEVTYLNAAYMSPLLKKVADVGVAGVHLKSRPYHIQPAYFFQIVNDVKHAFAKLVELDEVDRLAVIPAASYGIATIAQNLAIQPGEQIIVADEQFPSNYYTWERLARENLADMITINPASALDRAFQINQAILDAINEKTAVVALAHVHWADGLKYDLKAIREKTAEVGAKLIIDGTQSIGALPFSIKELQPDALVVAGYKWLMGPYSSGMMYLNENFDHGRPLEEGWINRSGSENFAHLVNYQSAYQPKAGRYAMGEQSNFINLPMLTTAIEQILDWTVEGINLYCEDIAASFLDQIQSIGGKVHPPEYRSAHLFGVRLPDYIDINQLKEKLVAAQIFVSIRGNAIRIAPHVYNTAADFEKLFSVFKALC